MGERQKCLSVLGLNEGANEDEIKKAYKRMALQYHPDKNGSDDAKGKFQEIGYAYKYLTEGPSAFNGIPDHDIGADMLRRLFEEMFYTSFHGRRGFPFDFFYDNGNDDDCCYDDSDNDEDWIPIGLLQQTSPGKYYQNTYPGPQRSGQTEQTPSKKQQRKAEKRQRHRDRDRERKVEKEEQRKYTPTPTYTDDISDDIRGDDAREKTESCPGNQTSARAGSRGHSPSPTQNQQKSTKKQKKKLEADQWKREQEMKEIATELLRKQEAEKEKQREKERLEAERRKGETEDNDAVLGWFDNSKMSRKAKQREKRRQEMVGTPEPETVTVNDVPLQPTRACTPETVYVETKTPSKEKSQKPGPPKASQNATAKPATQGNLKANHKIPGPSLTNYRDTKTPSKEKSQKPGPPKASQNATAKPATQGILKSNHKIPGPSLTNRSQTVDVSGDGNYRDTKTPSKEKSQKLGPPKASQNATAKPATQGILKSNHKIPGPSLTNRSQTVDVSGDGNYRDTKTPSKEKSQKLGPPKASQNATAKPATQGILKSNHKIPGPSLTNRSQTVDVSGDGNYRDTKTPSKEKSQKPGPPKASQNATAKPATQGNLKSNHQIPGPSLTNRYQPLSGVDNFRDLNLIVNAGKKNAKPKKSSDSQSTDAYTTTTPQNVKPWSTPQNVKPSKPQKSKLEPANPNKGQNQKKGLLGDYPGHKMKQFDRKTDSLSGVGVTRHKDNAGTSWEDIRNHSASRYSGKDTSRNGLFYPVNNVGPPPQQFNHPPSPGSDPFKFYSTDPFNPNIIHPPGFPARPRHVNPFVPDDECAEGRGLQGNPVADPYMDHRGPPQGAFNGTLPRSQSAQSNGPWPIYQDAQFNGPNPRFQDAQFNGSNPSFQNAQFSGPNPRFQCAQFNGPNPRFQDAKSNEPNPKFQDAQFNGPNPRFQDAKSNEPNPKFQDAQFNGPNPRFQDAKFNEPNPKFQDTQFNGPNPWFQREHFSDQGQSRKFQGPPDIQVDISTGAGDKHSNQPTVHDSSLHGNSDKPIHNKGNENVSGCQPSLGNTTTKKFDDMDAISSDESPAVSRTFSPMSITSADNNDFMTNGQSWADIAAGSNEAFEPAAEYGSIDHICEEDGKSADIGRDSLETLDDFTVPGLVSNYDWSAGQTAPQRTIGEQKYYPEGLGVASYIEDDLGVPDAIFTSKIQKYYVK